MLSSIGVIFQHKIPASLAGIVPLRHLRKVDKETSYKRAAQRSSEIFSFFNASIARAILPSQPGSFFCMRFPHFLMLGGCCKDGSKKHVRNSERCTTYPCVPLTREIRYIFFGNSVGTNSWHRQIRISPYHGENSFIQQKNIENFLQIHAQLSITNQRFLMHIKNI